MCPQTAKYVSSYCCKCVLLLYLCPLSPRYVSSYCYNHSIYVSAYCYISSVLILLYAGILSAIWYAKGVAQKILKESRKKEAEEALEAGRPICEHKRADVVGDGDVMLQMRIH